MSIPTADSLRRRNRKLDRRLRKAEEVIARMREGCALHLQFVAGNPQWFLSDGAHVDATVAAAVTKHPDIVDGGDALSFPGARAQTFRFSE
jgi:hypothetical protein